MASGEIITQEVEITIQNSSVFLEYSSDFIYGFAAQSLCDSYIADDALVKNGILRVKDLNLYQSEFFRNDTEAVRITGYCRLDTYLPFPVRIGFSVSCRAWGGGRMPHVSLPESEEKTPTVWEENNFTRGKIFRRMYGGNLPESFPVIAAFENGTAIMIKSLNHTMASYQHSGALEKTIRQMIDTLAAFDGAEYGGITIRKENIAQRKLILILPENDFDYLQEAAVRNMMQYSMLKFVMLDLQRYQKV